MSPKPKVYLQKSIDNTSLWLDIAIGLRASRDSIMVLANQLLALLAMQDS